MAAVTGELRHPKHGRPSRVWDYEGVGDRDPYVVARYDHADGKEFMPWHQNGQGPKPGYPPSGRSLYRAADVRAALEGNPKILVYWVEGEKAADAVWDAGGVATTTPGGCTNWHADDREGLAEQARELGIWRVFLWADRDEAGLKYARNGAMALMSVGVVPEGLGWSTLDVPTADAHDHFAEGLGFNDLQMFPVDFAEPLPEYPGDEENPAEPETLRTVRLDTVEMRSIEWLDKPLLQACSFTLLAGKKGAGKGTWIARQIARATTGDLFGRPVNVLVLSTEDSVSIDLKPRIVAAGGDDSRVHVIEQDVRLPRDAMAIVHTAEAIGDVGLLVIDPVANHMSGGDTDGEGAVRDAIAPLNGIADRLRCVVIGVRHLKKDTSTGALGSVLGSTAWVDVPRVVLVAAADNEDDMLFHVQPVAGNRGPKTGAGRVYRIELRDVGLEEPVTYASEEGESSKDVDVLLAPPTKKSGSSTARDLILEVLDRADGRMESDELDAIIARQAGVSAKTVKNLRSGLRTEGLISSVPERDESGAVTRWLVVRTNAPDPDLARGDRKTGPSVSKPFTTTSRLPVHADDPGSSNGHVPEDEVERLREVALEAERGTP